MRDDQRGAIAREPVQGFLNRSFAFIVERAGRLVENQDWRIFQKDARDAQPLLLPAGELHAAFADLRVVAVRQRHDEVVRMGLFRGLDDLVDARVGLAVAEILRDRSREQINVLLHDADILPQGMRADIPHVPAID